ncbi:hypothetical protein CPB85DRAFT_997138 [Mucidula mucida]|nr:hypothetical protein CPB85DRAFT_997138 [Mucidula mucida]
MAFITEGQDEYSRLFYPTARGYTPIQPHPVQLGVFSVEGVQIGDLVFRTSEGTILYSGMNVTRPCNDPRNFGTLPRNYAPVVLQQGIDYTVNNARFPSPGIFYSATAAFDVCSVPKTEESDSEKLEFSTNATAGAYCGLPFGGSSYDCTSIGLKKLQRAALANGHQWYYQLMHVDCFETQNGELCLVTGCDKASYWATGVFSSATSPVMKRMVMPHVDAETGAVKTGSLRIENWTPRAAQVDFAHISGRPDTSERLENQDSCITLRGFHIGLHDSLYNMAWCPTSTCQTFWQALPWPIQPRLKPWPVDSETSGSLSFMTTMFFPY